MNVFVRPDQIRPVSFDEEVAVALVLSSVNHATYVASFVRYRYNADVADGPLRLTLEDGTGLELPLVDSQLARAGGSEVLSAIYQVDQDDLLALSRYEISSLAFRVIPEKYRVVPTKQHRDSLLKPARCLTNGGTDPASSKQQAGDYQDPPEGSIALLDERNGFKDWKFGMSRASVEGCGRAQRQEMFRCDVKVPGKIGDIPFDGVTLEFAGNQLIGIDVHVSLDYPSKLVNAVRSAFGMQTEYWSPSDTEKERQRFCRERPDLAFDCISIHERKRSRWAWSGKKVTLEISADSPKLGYCPPSDSFCSPASVLMVYRVSDYHSRRSKHLNSGYGVDDF